MSGKRERRERQRQRAELGPGAPEWSETPRPHLELTCRTLDRMVALRNIVVADLGPHLSDDHKALLGWPLSRLDPEVAARVRERLSHREGLPSAAAARLLDGATKGAD